MEASGLVSKSEPREKEDEEALSHRYQKVLDTFTEYGVEVRRHPESPVQEGPGFFIFRVKPGEGINAKRVEGQAENLKLKLELPENLNPRAYSDRGSIVFEVPKQESERYYVTAEDLWDRVVDWPQDRLWVPIGEDIEGAAVSIDFSSNETPHLLIGGVTGSGKSIALETIIKGLLRNYSPEQLQISAVDPKGVELQFLEDSGHLKGEIGWDADDAKGLLDAAVQDMEARYAMMKSARVRKLSDYNAVDGVEPLPWRLVILDEFADLANEREDKMDIEHSLARLAQKARACGIHVIVATQKPSAEVLSTKIRSNLGGQLALRVTNATDSRIIMDESGAEALAGRGDAFLKTAGGGMVRFQCAAARSD
jgi:DNA segregation ATPase FtsK/SpoIIIE-like protein